VTASVRSVQSACWGSYVIFSAGCNIYISRLCCDVSVRLSVCDGSALTHYS